MTTNNLIRHKCLFCQGQIELAWDKRSHKCKCGVTYHYVPNAGRKSGKGYAERQAKKGMTQ